MPESDREMPVPVDLCIIVEVFLWDADILAHPKDTKPGSKRQ